MLYLLIQVIDLQMPSIEREDSQTSRSSVKVVDKTIGRLLISNQHQKIRPYTNHKTQHPKTD